jgi:hypothetical protein
MLIALGTAGCPDDVPDECRTTCETCCTQAEECDAEDHDACFTRCLDGCERAYALYRHTGCFESRIALDECECALDCSELDEWRAGTADTCAEELHASELECEWF